MDPGLERAVALADTLIETAGPYFAADALCTRSDLARQRGETADAIEFGQRCVAAWEALREPSITAQMFLALAATQDQTGTSDAAYAAALDLASTDVERAQQKLARLEILGVRGDLPALEAALPDAIAAVDTLRAANPDTTSRSALSSRAVSFIEMAAAWLSQTQLERSLELSEIARGAATETSIDLPTLREGLPGDTSLVVFMMPETFDEGVAVVLTQESQRVVRLPRVLGIGRRIDAWTGLLSARDAGATEAGQQLHDALITPLGLRTDRVVIFPSGPLHRIAWAALSDGEASLAERHVLTKARSLASWSAPPPLRPLESSLVVADPTAPADALPALPHAREEAAQVQAVLGLPTTTLIGETATKAGMMEAHEADWIHVAAHGVVDHRFPERTALHLANGDTLTTDQLETVSWEHAVVVLSACRSAGGRVLGDRPLGLADAFLDAGASTVVGNLWPMKDAQARDFFERYYDHLETGARLDDALALTQRDLAASGAPEEAWAGVVLLGDGRRTLPRSARSPIVLPAALGSLILLLIAGVLLWRRP